MCQAKPGLPRDKTGFVMGQKKLDGRGLQRRDGTERLEGRASWELNSPSSHGCGSLVAQEQTTQVT